jgi:hypothetical protein
MDFDSSAIRHATYNAETKELDIEFNHGGVYRYSGVPVEEAEAFAAASSKGGFFHAYIRGKYEFRLVDPVVDEVASVVENDINFMKGVQKPATDPEAILWQYATIFRDIFTKNMDVSPEGRMNMAVGQLRAMKGIL